MSHSSNLWLRAPLQPHCDLLSSDTAFSGPPVEPYEPQSNPNRVRQTDGNPTRRYRSLYPSLTHIIQLGEKTTTFKDNLVSVQGPF